MITQDKQQHCWRIKDKSKHQKRIQVARTDSIKILQKEDKKGSSNKRKRGKGYEKGLALCVLLLEVMFKEEEHFSVYN